jgi:hypothetical protein
MTIHNLKFTYKKSTPGTRVYEEDVDVGEKPVVGSLYIKKAYAGEADMVDVTLVIPD